MRRLAVLLALSTMTVPVIVGLAAGTGGATAAGSGSATGTIVTTGATPLAGMCVNVVTASSNVSVGTSATTTANGIWQLSGIPSATPVIAYARDCSGGNYVGAWWVNTPFQSDAKPFTVGSGATRTGINFNLKLGGAVTGKVTDAATKKPVADILVIPFRLDQEAAAAYSACTATNGTYSLHGLPTTGVKVEFLANGCTSTPYVTQWYNNMPDYASATVVHVGKNKTHGRINAQLVQGG
jgi:hypothetical protein